MDQDTNAKRLVVRGRWKIFPLVALFTLPVLVAYALYFGEWRPASTGNHGELVQPARTIADVTLQTLEGKQIHFSDLYGKWTLIAFGAAKCPKSCEKNLYDMRQVIAALGKEAGRVRSVFVLTDVQALDWLRHVVKDYPGMQVIVGPAPEVVLLARQLTLPDGSPLEGRNRLYLVDPLGNFMMSYTADADPAGIRKDLVRLLRVSRIG